MSYIAHYKKVGFYLSIATLYHWSVILLEYLYYDYTFQTVIKANIQIRLRQLRSRAAK